MPEVFPLIGGYEVLVGERLLILFTPLRGSLSRVSKRKKPLAPSSVKDSSVQTNVLQRLLWVNGVKEEDYEGKI